MGIYINPPDCTKEEWLAKNSIGGYSLKPLEKYRDGDNFAVCLVDNVLFRAAAVAFNQRELDDFKRPDGRKKHWFMVPLAALQTVLSPREMEILNG